MSGTDDDKKTNAEVYSYASMLVTGTCVTIFGIFILFMMVKHKTFSDIEWRIKVVLLAYSLGGPTYAFWILFTKIVNYHSTLLLNFFTLLISVWTCIHW